MFNVTGIYVRWVAEWEHETHGREQQVWQTGIEYENEQDSDSEKVPGVSVTGAAELCDVESESCQINLRRVWHYTKQQPIVWRSELYHKHLLLIIIVCVTAPRDVLINTVQLVVLVKDQLAHRLITNIHRGGCGYKNSEILWLWWLCEIFHLYSSWDERDRHIHQFASRAEGSVSPCLFSCVIFSLSFSP